MAEQNIKITFEIDGIQQSVSSVEELQSALKGVDTQAAKTEGQLNDTANAAKNVGEEAQKAGENGEAGLKVLDEATGGLATKVKEVGGGLKTLGSNAVGAFKSAVTGASAMGKALIATGIGAIVVALGLIVAYWDDIVGAISGVSSEQKQLLADTEAEVAARQSALDATMASENSLKLAGMSEKEIRDLKIQQTNETIAAMEAQLTLQKEQSAAQVAALERNKTIAQNVIRFLTAPVTLLLSAIDALTYGLKQVGVLSESSNLEEQFSGGIAGLIFDPEAAKEEGDKTQTEIEGQLAKLKNTRDGYILEGKKQDAEAVKSTADTQKELNAELEKLRAENLQDAEAKALALLEIERKAAEQALIQKGASDELLLELEKNFLAKAQAIKDGFAKEAEDKALANRQIIDDLLKQANLDSIDDTFARARKELEIQQQTDLEKLRLAGATGAEINKINASYTKKNKDLDKEEADFKKQLREADIDAALGAASSIFGNVAGLLEEGSAGAKAASIAQTTIDTYQSATAAYKSVVGIPVVGPVLAPIAAGVAVAAGIASVKKIIATKVPGDRGTSSQVPSVGGIIPSAPPIDPTQALADAQGNATGENQIQLGEQVGSSGATIVRAYVVSSDMTSQQEADKKINDLARL